MFRKLTTLLALTGAMACAPEASNAPAKGTIQLEWAKGDTFHVAANYRMAENMSEENGVSLNEAMEEEGRVFGEAWSDDVVWTYKVVESGFVPSEGDDLFDFAHTPAGIKSLSVIKVTLDPSLNDDPALLESDPVIYLVFHEDRDRLAGVVEFLNVNGERVERAYGSKKLGKSWGFLSQSMLTKAPTYLAPFSARFGNSERTLENGSLVTSHKVDAYTTDVAYDDAVDGGLVVSRYESGAPWPTWTVAENVESRLLNSTDVEGIRGELPMYLPEDEQLDYKDALRASIDIDSAMSLDAETIENGGWEAQTREDYTPWAGDWWNLKEAELVFGYNGKETISTFLKEDIKQLKLDMDELSSQIRDLKDDEDKDEREEKTEEYQAKQKELVEKLVDYYNGVRDDFDGGRILVEDGKVKHTEDGWEIEIDDLSPFDKFALSQQLIGNNTNNPWFLPAWEILNQWNPGGEGWWGHCNGWAAAAVLTNEPVETLEFDADGTTINFTTADQKGLLSESHYSTYSNFYGERYNDEDDDVSDLKPEAFQKIVSFYLKEQGVGFVFDTTATEQVWNFPVWKVNLNLSETTPEGAESLVNINTASVEALDELPGIGPSKGQAIVDYREANGPFQTLEEIMDVSGIGEATYEGLLPLITIEAFQRTFDVTAYTTLTTDGVDPTHVDSGDPESIHKTWGYTLTTDADGVILDSKWDDDKNHPDFAWVPYYNPGASSNGSSENPFLAYDDLKNVLGEEIERK